MPVVDGGLTDVKALGLAYLPDMQRSVWSAMLQDEWQIAPDWHLTAGLRYDYYTDFGSTVNPRLALVWDVTERLTSKLLYGKAFRAPTFAEMGNVNNPVILGNPNLEPETNHTVELAFDYRPWHNLRTAANVYYYAIEDLIQPVLDANGTSATAQNTGEQTGYGLELADDRKLEFQRQLRLAECPQRAARTAEQSAGRRPGSGKLPDRRYHAAQQTFPEASGFGGVGAQSVRCRCQGACRTADSRQSAVAGAQLLSGNFGAFLAVFPGRQFQHGYLHDFVAAGKQSRTAGW